MGVNVIKISLNTKNTMQNKVRLKICTFFWISVKKFFGIFLYLVIIRN